jgi:hypothetical protein
LNRMKRGTYESVCFQHRTKPLCFAIWSDNNLVKTLSNFHPPTILAKGAGVLRKKRGMDGKRERTRSEVPCPVQNKHYSETFHLIDKGNGKEAKYDLGGQSKQHNWSPKVFWRLINISMANAFVLYNALAEEHNPNSKPLDMKGAIKEATHAFCQRGESMRKRKAGHPSWIRDLSVVHSAGTGRKIRTDKNGTVSKLNEQAEPVCRKGESYLQVQQRKSPWRIHQSVAGNIRKHCVFECCPNMNNSSTKRKRSYQTTMCCEECSVSEGRDVYLCNDVKNLSCTSPIFACP